jgi:hypothetical protein
MPELKNETFIKNIVDPKTGKQVKKIYQIKVSKLNRLVEPLVWEYYKNRANTSISDIYKKFNGYQLKFIYFGDPVIHTVNTIDNYEQVDNLPNNSTLKKLREKNLLEKSVEVSQELND